MCSLWGHFYFYFRSIRRIIFYSLIKPSINEKGEKELEPITTSQALQIAGRAGRFSSHFKEGEVTTMYSKDLALLKEILSRPVDPIQVRPACHHYCFVQDSHSCPPPLPQMRGRRRAA